MGWKIVALSEPIEGQTIIIDRDMVIGRHQQADIVLQASHVSRRHAVLLLKENGRQLWIQDLESSNGTFVNGAKIIEQQLKNLDEINFETIRFQVLAEAGVSVAITPEAPDLEKTVPSDEGMPTLEERSVDVQVSREGMPTNVNVPKPAPIPPHVNVNTQPEPKPVAIAETETRIQQVAQEQKNTKVGLITFIVLIILIVLAGLFFLGQ